PSTRRRRPSRPENGRALTRQAARGRMARSLLLAATTISPYAGGPICFRIRRMFWGRWLLALCWAVVLGLLVEPASVSARDFAVAGRAGWIEMGALPPEAVGVLRKIRRGGPFRYAKDGSVFGNRERLLPRQARGYYTEYTVTTP